MLTARPLWQRMAQFSSVFQAGIRWNGYVTLGVLAGLCGDEGALRPLALRPWCP
jgi:hypothetical protein